MSQPIHAASYYRGFHAGAGALVAAFLESVPTAERPQMVAIWQKLERLRSNLQPADPNREEEP